MRRIGLPEGLIRYTSENRLTGRHGFSLSGRVVIYTIALLALVSLFSFLLAVRSDVEISLLRAPGTLFFETDDGNIRNLYSLQLVNKTNEEIPVSLRLQTPDSGTITMLAGDMVVKPGAVVETPVMIDLPRNRLDEATTTVRIGVFSGDRLLDELTTSFAGPNPMKER